MNTVGPALLLALMAFSWEWQDFSNLNWQDYNDVEQGLESFIDGYIKENLPDASEVQFYDFKSESIDESNIRVFFEYKFNHPIESDGVFEDTALRLKGSTTLEKKMDEQSEYWQMGEINILEESISYLKELVVTDSNLENLDLENYDLEGDQSADDPAQH